MSEPLTKYTGHLVEGLAWTKEKPTVPGWYWARWPNNPRLGAEVLCVTQPHGPDTEYLEFDDVPLEEYIAEWHPQWSGPIPLPTDVPAQDWYKASEVEAWIAGCIPTNWCDSLLTGDRRVIGDAPYNCDDIEALLAGIKRRLLNQLRNGRE